MSEKEFGTPIKCANCGYEDNIRLTKGTQIRNLWCSNCHQQGTMRRNTYYDKKEEAKKERSDLK